MIRSIHWIAVLSLFFLLGCDQASLMRRWTAPEDESTARSYVDQLRQKRFDQIERDWDPSVEVPNMPDTLAQMSAVFPAQEPTSIKVVGSHVYRGKNVTSTAVTLEYEFPGKWVLAEVVTKKSDGVITIAGFHVRPISDSVENLNRFTLVDKGASQYTILLLALLSMAFSFYVFALCIRTKIERRKWLWLILILTGVGRLGVNWTSGQHFFTLLAFNLPPSGAFAPLFGPWAVFTTLPLGAIAFLMRQGVIGGASETVAPAEKDRNCPE